MVWTLTGGDGRKKKTPFRFTMNQKDVIVLRVESRKERRHCQTTTGLSTYRLIQNLKSSPRPTPTTFVGTHTVARSVLSKAYTKSVGKKTPRSFNLGV